MERVECYERNERKHERGTKKDEDDERGVGERSEEGMEEVVKQEDRQEVRLVGEKGREDGKSWKWNGEEGEEGREERGGEEEEGGRRGGRREEKREGKERGKKEKKREGGGGRVRREKETGEGKEKRRRT